MLDDLKYIHQKDAQDALGLAGKQSTQLLHNFELARINLTSPVHNVVFSGMGGSALAALLSTTWPGHTVPFEISRNYTIPGYVNANTLFIASSYSGNTEETLEALDRAEQRNAQIMIITSGGELAKHAVAKGYPFALMPSGLQPRMASLYNLKAFISLLEAARVVHGKIAELESAAPVLDVAVKVWAPDVPTSNNPAKQLAEELMGRSVVVYAGPLLFPAAYKWKISFNENAKTIAWCNQYPEFNHNEFLGWTSHPTEKPYSVIDLKSSFEHSRILKRFDVTARLLSGRRPEALSVTAEGESLLQQLLWTVVYGDYVSLYLALLNGLNPTPVDLIEKFKHLLAE